MPKNFLASTIKTRSSLMQAHCRRISDYLVLGENVWWYCKDGHICFLDGPEESVGHSHFDAVLLSSLAI
jgi:hypothetical protein